MSSRQARWQREMAAQNRCRVCGKPEGHFKGLCDSHGLTRREQVRRYGGFKPKVAGGPGRPPVIPEHTVAAEHGAHAEHVELQRMPAIRTQVAVGVLHGGNVARASGDGITNRISSRFRNQG